MTLDEAILHAEEVADRCALTDGNIQCENDHRQLAEWLKELKDWRSGKIVRTANKNTETMIFDADVKCERKKNDTLA